MGIMQLKKISGSDRASIYIVSPYEDLYAEDFDKFKLWLHQYCPNEYDLDGKYLTITSRAETILALTFELV